MRMMGERGRASRPERPAAGPSLKTMIAFFGKLRAKQGWSHKKLHQTYFSDRVSMATLKLFLSGNVPNRPHIPTLKGFRDAYEQARVEQHPDYIMYKLKIAKLKRPEPSDGEMARYTGDYETWRFSRNGLVQGTLRIDRHPDSRIPYHWQEHQRMVGARLQQNRVFKYEGPIYLLTHNLHLSALGDGYFRNTKCIRVHDPRKQEMVGMYLSEEFGTNNPFAVKVLFLHEEWLQDNRDKVTQEWICGMLRNGAACNRRNGQDRLAI